MQSIHEDPRLLEAAPFAETIKNAIFSVDPADPTRDPVPYTGVQFVAIPEFQGIGNYVGQQVAAALAGQQSVEEALANSQQVRNPRNDQGRLHQVTQLVSTTRGRIV